MSNFSPKFLEAIQRVVDRSKASPELTERIFKDEMVKLGWKERQNNLYRIKAKADGKFKFFRWNSPQRYFAETRKGRDTILKARQFGFTTWACIYAYDRALFDDWTTGIMSHQRERTEKIFDIVKNADEWFVKDWGHLYNPTKDTSSSNKIMWSDSKASITVSFDFRSLTVQFLHVSEAAFIEDERLSNSLQSVPETGEVIEESTPNGPQGLFYHHWQLWKKDGDRAPYQGVFFPWYMNYPENPDNWKNKKLDYDEKERELSLNPDIQDYHLAWRRWKIHESFLGKVEEFEKEYPSDDQECFLSGDSQVYSSNILKAQKSFVRDPSFIGILSSENRRVTFYKDSKGLLKVWSLPEPDREYAIGADASEGVGNDAAVAYVLDRITGETVAELRGQIPPTMFADELWKLGKFYNFAWINPERNNHGHVVIEELIRKGYSKIYKQQVYDEIAKKNTTKLGFLTSSQSKIPLTEQHVTACRNLKFRCASETLLLEMSNFIQLSSKNGRSFRREARGEAKDDCVMAACLAWEMHKVLGDTTQQRIFESDVYRNAEIDPDTGFILNTFAPQQSEMINDFSDFLFES